MKNDDITIWDCPKCGKGKLIKRKSKTGNNFLGCTEYPKCTYTQKNEKSDDGGVADAASVWE
jgi:ssDNA-binding Zn-finger/Zn-ribbon topoisomerase 1